MAYKINKQSWIQLKATKDDNYNLPGIGEQMVKG
jgi:phage baseplate assembly protein gpV